MHWLVDIAYGLAAALYLPVALYKAVVLGKNRRGWRQRFGYVPMRDPCKERIWVHAVSVGEVNATPRLVSQLREKLPHAEVVMSTTTDTGYARACQLFGSQQVFRFPLDFSFAVARVLRRVRPTMIVLVELEVWYNLMHQAARQGLPVVVINGRLTERSARRLAKLGPLSRAMFSRLRWVGAQDEEIAARFRGLGVAAKRVEVTSSLKWDSASISANVEGREALAAALGLSGPRTIWVCGSTGPGEESIILDAYEQLLRSPKTPPNASAEVAEHSPIARKPFPTLVVVPRKPERFDEVASLIERRGFTCVRRSVQADGTTASKIDERTVILGDTMGELRKFYSLADVVFVGRSLVPMGGSDPMEVAALGKAMIVGPHTDNFASPVLSFRCANAIRVVDSANSLAVAVLEILSDRSLAEGLGQRGREVVLSNQGGTARTVDRLLSILQPSTPDRAKNAAPLPAPATPVGPV